MSATPITTAKPQTPNITSTLAAKLARVSAQMKRIPKNGDNKSQGYKYATEGDIKDTVREALAEQGVVMVPHVRTPLEWREIPTRNGSMRCVTMTVDYHITDGVETLVVAAIGEGSDSGDKCVPKAYTMSLKYLLLTMFQISTGDDMDAEREDNAPPRRNDNRQPTQSRPPQSGAHDDHALSEVVGRIGGARTLEQLKATQDAIKALPGDDKSGPQAEARQHYMAAKKRIESQTAASASGNVNQ